MCGIAGRWRTSAASAPLAAALEELVHRGPDDSGEWTDPSGKIDLGHRRLSIIDLSPTGHQPMHSLDGQATIIFNGEIYNFRELREQLVGHGHSFRGSSDTEVLLAAYRQYGKDLLARLNGIFAFALFDHSTQEIFLARDECGVKPLYFAENSHGFSFASELKALLRLMPISRELDPSAIARYLGFLWCPGVATPLKEVQRLAPGEALIVRDGAIRRHWRWARTTIEPAADALAAEDAPAAVREALREAVRRQLVSDVPVGAFLSGGLDSSAIVAFAKEDLPSLETFTIVTEGGRDAGEVDDVPYARFVANHFGLKLHEVFVSSQTMADDLLKMVYQLDEPLADPAALNVLYISRLARAHGAKVLLSGAGGDDLFSGYRRHRALTVERAWTGLPRGVRSLLRSTSTAAAARSPRLRRLAKAFAHADLSAERRLASYFLWADQAQVEALFVEPYRRTVGRESLVQPMLEFLDGLPAGVDPLSQMLALEQRFFLGDHNLTYTDKMSMAASVEVRVPFLDRDLVRLANRLPASVKMHRLQAKWVLKEAMRPLLPAKIIDRPKSGFGSPLRRWLRAELRDVVGDYLSEETLRRRGLFEPAAVSALVAADRAGRKDAAYTILGLICVELWCRQFVDG